MILQRGFEKHYEPVDMAKSQVSTPPIQNPSPPMSPFLLSALPPMNADSDALRQFYRHGIPQMRVFPLQLL